MTESNGQAELQGRPLHLLTTQGVLAELVSGRGIETASSGTFTLASVDARAVLGWYRGNVAKWSGSLGAADAEAIVDSLATSLGVVPATAAGTEEAGPRLRLKRVTAHHYAGLHAAANNGAFPEPFVFEPSMPLTLFEGWNGSGKTSIANAIVWCLTGQILRPQRMPESGGMEFPCEVERDDGATSHGMSAVTPLPASVAAGAKAVPCDTWVELALVTVDGVELPPIRRSQTRDSRSKLVETPPDLAGVGIDPISVRLGTTMPGMLPYLQVGSASELGVAVAKLTGLADLVDLARHAIRAKERIGKRMIKEINDQIDAIDLRYAETRKDLADRNVEFPAMAPKMPLPVASLAATEDMDALRTHYETRKADGLRDARQVLGESFDPDDAASRLSLEDSIAPAEATLRMKEIPSLNRLRSLKLTPEEIDSARRTIATLSDEAAVLAKLQANPERTKRLQLYARVSSWMHEHDETSLEKCVVCQGELEGATDPLIGGAYVPTCRRSRLMATCSASRSIGGVPTGRRSWRVTSRLRCGTRRLANCRAGRTIFFARL